MKLTKCAFSDLPLLAEGNRHLIEDESALAFWKSLGFRESWRHMRLRIT